MFLKMDTRLRGYDEGKDVQKVYPARPQKAKRRNVLRYVVSLSEARTKSLLDKSNTRIRHGRIKLIRNSPIITQHLSFKRLTIALQQFHQCENNGKS